VGILGLTFKENVPDIRNSKVEDIWRELRDFGIEPLIHDPLAEPAAAEHEFGISLSPLEAFADLDAVIYAVSHREYAALGGPAIAAMLRPGGVLVDVKSASRHKRFRAGVQYWSL
jgi:UDP-N-acetyl-D-galactosamine dehydrogenase